MAASSPCHCTPEGLATAAAFALPPALGSCDNPVALCLGDGSFPCPPTNSALDELPDAEDDEGAGFPCYRTLEGGASAADLAILATKDYASPLGMMPLNMASACARRDGSFRWFSAMWFRR